MEPNHVVVALPEVPKIRQKINLKIGPNLAPKVEPNWSLWGPTWTLKLTSWPSDLPKATLEKVPEMPKMSQTWIPEPLKTRLPLQRERVSHLGAQTPETLENDQPSSPKVAQSDHRDPKMSPKVPRRLPMASPKRPKDCPKAPRCRRKACTKSPKPSQRVPKGPQGGSKAPQSEEIKKLDPIIRDFYSLRCLQRHAHAEKGRMYSFAILQIFPASLPTSLCTSIRTVFLCAALY